MTGLKSVDIVGVGNIGSQAASHLARMPGTQVTIIDPDVCEVSNISGQEITPAAVGVPKAEFHAARLREINPAARIRAIALWVEQVPLGMLRADVILGAVDSPRTRAYLSEAAWRLGIPYVDAAIDGEDMLARIQVFVPGPTSACYACCDHRFAVDTVFRCDPGLDAARATPATQAPSTVGGLAAALLAIECAKVLGGEEDVLATDRRILIDARHHQHFVTRYERDSEQCRFDHESWSEDILPVDWKGGALPLADVLACGAEYLGGGGSLALGSLTLEVFKQPFATLLRCACGHAEDCLGLVGRLPVRGKTCPGCDQEMVAHAFDRADRLFTDEHAHSLNRSLASVGCLEGDIVTVTSTSETSEDVHLELTEKQEDRRSQNV